MKVYAIAEKSRRGLVKVGIAKDERSRLAALQTAAASQLRLVHSQPVENARLVERVAHYMLREKRAAGEWFKVSEREALRAISEAVASIDEPGWRPPWEIDREKKREADATSRAAKMQQRRAERAQQKADAKASSAQWCAQRKTSGATLHVRIPHDLREALEAIAAGEDRTLSKVVERALADCVRAAKQKKGRGA